MSNTNIYESPLSSRYASDEMLYLFSPDKKFATWRRLWVALARAEMELGLPVTKEQVEELEAHIDDINYEVAAKEEKKLRHDVMAHVHAYGAQCPKAMPIIHLGATSCYVGDNTDIILMREGLILIRDQLVRVLHTLARFAETYRALPTLGFTHFQPAQLVTVGKRATLWMNELLMDLEEVEHRISTLKLLGSKGTTGTQASFLELFEGDHEKVKLLEEKIAKEMGFTEVVPVSGQTYSRKVDAMPYKRNPMRCERICSLARYVIADAQNPAITAATQWFERTLDDSANKRISVPEAFLSVNAILNIYENVCAGLVVHEKVIDRHIQEELPFMASENIMMDAVKRGGDRQQLHERIRVLSQEAGKNVKDLGLTNNLIDLMAADPMFGMTREELTAHLEASRYIGRCPEQVEEFLEGAVRPVFEKYPQALRGKDVELKV